MFRNGTKYLTVFAGNDSYKLKNTDFADYDFLKENITKGKTQIEPKLNKTALLIACTFFLFIGILSTGFACYSYWVKDNKLAVNDVATVGGIIVNPVRISNTGGESSRNYIRVILYQYPDFIFDIYDVAYRVTNRRAYLEYVKPGDSVYLDVLADVYKKKITGQMPLGFFDKTVNYKKISVYGLRDKHANYLTLKDYNNADQLRGHFYPPLVLGTFFLIMGIILTRAVYRQESWV